MALAAATHAVCAYGSTSSGPMSGAFRAGLVPHTRAKVDTPDDSANIRFLTTISAVCSLWRDIALSTQGLWTTITYECHANSGDRTECLEAFLARSRNASIFLHVVFRRDSTVHVQRIHSILKPHLWRCRSFAIISDQHIGFQRFFFPLPGRMERLEEFALLEVGGGEAGPTTLFAENGAPLLRQLTIHSTLTHRVPFTTDHIPTNTLTHLDLMVGSVMQEHIVQFLRQCAAVVWLHFCVFPTQLPSPFEPISLPSLKTLSVQDDLTLGFRSLFSTPNLMVLHLRRPLRPVLVYPNLPPLPIETVECTFQDLRQLHLRFSAFPSVKKLMIRRCLITLNLPKCLAGFPEDSSDSDPPPEIESSESRETHILPQLEYLEMVQCERGRPSMGEWLKVLLICRASLFVSIDVQSFGPPSSETEGTTMETLKAQFGPRFTVLGDLDG